MTRIAQTALDRRLISLLDLIQQQLEKIHLKRTIGLKVKSKAKADMLMKILRWNKEKMISLSLIEQINEK